VAARRPRKPRGVPARPAESLTAGMAVDLPLPPPPPPFGPVGLSAGVAPAAAAAAADAGSAMDTAVASGPATLFVPPQVRRRQVPR
jgi:hypothetical protein